MERGKIDPTFTINELQDDFVVAEIPSGVRPATPPASRDRRRHQTPVTDGDAQLVLYVVSLFGVTNAQDELVSGDALLVRPKGTPAMALLSFVLDCPVQRLPDLLARSGSWAVRELPEIDGHRVRFDP